MPDAVPAPFRRFVAVGSGRSGTGYVCYLLRASGVHCGHEQVFGPAVAAGTAPVVWGDYAADSSWLAVPSLPMLGVPVLAVLRHPLAVVASMVRVGLFTGDRGHLDPYTSVYYRARPEIARESTEPDRALSAWLHWYILALSCADVTVRVENLDAPMLADVLVRLAGRCYDSATAAATEALAVVTEAGDKVRNRKTAETRTVHRGGWEVHRPALARTARDLAAACGYDPDRVPA